MLRFCALILLCLPLIAKGGDVSSTINLEELKHELRKVDLPLPNIQELENVLRDRYTIITTEVIGNDLWFFQTLKKVSIHYTPQTNKKWHVAELEVAHTMNPIGWILCLVFLGLAVVSGLHGEDKVRAGASMTGIVFGIVLSVTTLVLNRVLETQLFSTIAVVLLFFGIVVAIEQGARWVTIAQATGTLVGGIIALYIGTPEFARIFTNLLIFSGIAVGVEFSIIVVRTAIRFHKILRGVQNSNLQS